jgi:hypothetical protein
MAKAAPARVGLRFLDRLILFTAWLVTCGLVYGLGFYTGKGTQERRLGMEERIVRLPVTSEVPAEGQRPKAATEFTFYETLVSGDRGRDGGHIPKPTQAPTGAVAMPPAEMQPPVPGTIPAKPAGPPPTMPIPARPAAPPPPSKPVAQASRPVPGPTGASMPLGDVPVPSTVAATGTPPSTAMPQLQVATAKPVAPKPPAARGFTVEASPTRDRGAADTLLANLKGRGYQASVVSVRRDGDTWYRVRIGRYPTAEQASEAMRRLRERDGVAHAFVAAE